MNVRNMLVLLVLAMLAGCSGVQLAYRNADLLIENRAEDLLDLDDAQLKTWQPLLADVLARHRRAEVPDLVQAALAIDALACLVDGLGDRLGPEAPTMVDALQNIRLAFVQIKGQTAPEG